MQTTVFKYSLQSKCQDSEAWASKKVENSKLVIM